MARAQLAATASSDHVGRHEQPRRPGQQVDRLAASNVDCNSNTFSANCQRLATVSWTRLPTSASTRRQISGRSRKRQSQMSHFSLSRRYFKFLHGTGTGIGTGQQHLAGYLLLVLVLLVHLPLNRDGRQIEAVQASELAMNLPDGIENILGFVPKSTFKCERDGYFGDIDNDCKIFHLCQRNTSPGAGKSEWRHWTYACGNQTMFNQLTLTCAFVDEAIPCQHSSQFQYLNEVIHKPAEPFLTDADVTSGVSYYSNRIMSDGARARAFQDSQLLAQIGGGLAQSASKLQQQQQQQAAFASAPLATSSALLEPESASEAGSNQEASSSQFLQSNNLGPGSLQNTFQPTNRLGNRDSSPASASSFASFQTATNSIAVGQRQQSQPLRQPTASAQPPTRPLQSVNSGRRQTQETRRAPTSGASQNLQQPLSRPQVDLIENHAWQLQHQPVQPQQQQQQPQQQQQRQQFVFSQPWQQRWQEPQSQPQPQLQAQQPRQQNQPQAASSNSWQQFSSPQLGGSQQSSQASSGAQLNSFQFSISTNHANTGSPFNTFVSSTTTTNNEPRQPQQQQQLQPQQFGAPQTGAINTSNSEQVDLRGSTIVGASLASFTAAPVSSIATTEPLQVVPSSTQPTIELQQGQQPTTTTTTSVAAATPPTTTATRSLTTSSTTDAPLPSSTLAVSSNFSNGQSFQLVQPTQATPSIVSGETSSTATASAPIAATTTTTATSSPPISTTTTTTSASGAGGQARRALAVRTNSSSGPRRQQAPRRSNDLSGFDRSHVGFQSERLSAVSRRMAAASNVAATPLVMRRNSSRPPSSSSSSSSSFSSSSTSSSSSSSSSSSTTSNQVQQQQQQQQRPQQQANPQNNRLQLQQQQPAAAGSSTRTSSALLDTAGPLAGNDFWRHPFDSQLLVPKFESILLRRRVLAAC